MLDINERAWFRQRTELTRDCAAQFAKPDRLRQACNDVVRSQATSAAFRSMNRNDIATSANRPAKARRDSPAAK
jgi:hypothetical protein